jgi:hypothetical protein
MFLPVSELKSNVKENKPSIPDAKFQTPTIRILCKSLIDEKVKTKNPLPIGARDHSSNTFQRLYVGYLLYLTSIPATVNPSNILILRFQNFKGNRNTL